MPAASIPLVTPPCTCNQSGGVHFRALRINARARRASRIDPQRLGPERRAFEREIRRRLRALWREIKRIVVTEDDYGLGQPSLGIRIHQQRYRFLSSAAKLEHFAAWLQTQIDAKLLSIEAGSTVWTAKYVESSFRKGIVRAWVDTHKGDIATKTGVQMAAERAEFLRGAFAAPETLDKVRLLATRTFERMKGMSEVMKSQLNTALADGIANGLSPQEVGRRMYRDIQTISRKRAMTIARTEMASAHSEGQLNGFEELGMAELTVMAEWATAGDDKVCPQCSPLEGQVFTIDEARGMLPRHPNCRCAWIPSDKDKLTRQEKEKRARRLDQSVKAETGLKSRASARGYSRWVGADV